MTVRCNALNHGGNELPRPCGELATRLLPPACTRYGTPGLCERHWREQLRSARYRAAQENALVLALETATAIEVAGA